MATEGYVNVPMDENMIAATLISLEHTINHCTRTRDELTAFVMARQAQSQQAAAPAGPAMLLGELEQADAAAAAAGAVTKHMTDLGPATDPDNL